MVCPLFAGPAHMGAQLRRRFSGITEMGNVSTTAYRLFDKIATGGCHSGGGMLACPRER